MLLVGGGFWWPSPPEIETWHATYVTCGRIDIRHRLWLWLWLYLSWLKREIVLSNILKTGQSHFRICEVAFICHLNAGWVCKYLWKPNTGTWNHTSCSKLNFSFFKRGLGKIVAIYALLVCKIFGPKIRSCKFFDKSQVCSLIDVWLFSLFYAMLLSLVWNETLS